MDAGDTFPKDTPSYSGKKRGQCVPSGTESNGGMLILETPQSRISPEAPDFSRPKSPPLSIHLASKALTHL